MGAGCQRHALAAALPRKRRSTHFTEGCVRRSTSLEGAEILASTGIRSPKGSPSIQPLPTKLSRPTY